MNQKVFVSQVPFTVSPQTFALLQSHVTYVPYTNLSSALHVFSLPPILQEFLLR